MEVYGSTGEYRRVRGSTMKYVQGGKSETSSNWWPIKNGGLSISSISRSILIAQVLNFLKRCAIRFSTKLYEKKRFESIAGKSYLINTARL